jgi:hypothetical protein
MKRVVLYVLLVYALSYALYTVWANTLPEVIVMSDVFMYIFHKPGDVIVLISCFVVVTTICFLIVEKKCGKTIIGSRMAVMVNLIFFVFLMIIGIPWKQPPFPLLFSIEPEQENRQKQ